MNCSNIGVNILVGNLGGSSWTTCLSCSNGVFESKQGPTSTFCQRFGKLKDTSGPGGIVYKNVMAKTRREKGKESELQVCL